MTTWDLMPSPWDPSEHAYQFGMRLVHEPAADTFDHEVKRSRTARRTLRVFPDQSFAITEEITYTEIDAVGPAAIEWMGE